MARFSLWFATWMLALSLALFLMFCPSASRAAPACFPGEPTASSTLPVITADSTGCAAVWFCDEGTGSWMIHWVAGTGAECDYGYAKAIAVLALTHDEKAALWDANVPAATASAPETRLASAVPPPNTPPATGLTTKEVKVYKLVVPINAAPKFSLIGTTKLGTPCDVSLKVGSLYRVDRSLVTFPKGVIMPAATFAKCD